MLQDKARDILALAEQEEADALIRGVDADSLIWRSDVPWPWPPSGHASSR